MFLIKIRVKGYLNNITDKNKEKFDTFAIKNKNKITYMDKNTSYKIETKDNLIILIRDNKEFMHKFIFDIDNITKSEYYIKELNTNIEVEIMTTEIKITEEQIKIKYKIIDNNNEYIFFLDLE